MYLWLNERAHFSVLVLESWMRHYLDSITIYLINSFIEVQCLVLTVRAVVVQRDQSASVTIIIITSLRHYVITPLCHHTKQLRLNEAQVVGLKGPSNILAHHRLEKRRILTTLMTITFLSIARNSIVWTTRTTSKYWYSNSLFFTILIYV